MTMKKIIFAKNGVEIFGENNLNITGKESRFYKEKNILEVLKNVKILDTNNGFTILSDKIKHDRNEQFLISIGKTKILYKNIYELQTSDIIFYKNKNKIISKKKSILQDDMNNKFYVSDFEFDVEKNIYIKQFKFEYQK